MVEGSDGSLYSFGHNARDLFFSPSQLDMKMKTTEGALGLGDGADRLTPSRVSIASVVSVQAYVRGAIALGG